MASPIDHQPGDEDRITLMTIQSAKGKEWPLVFIVGAEDGTIPSFQCKTEAEIEEERRVLYVAMTRAKRRLIISHVTDWKGHHKTASPLLDGIPAALVQRRTVQNGRS